MGIFSRLANHLDRRSDLMGGMMERLGVDPGAFDTLARGQQLGNAARACAMCSHGDECAGWQEAHADGAEKAPDFCPNAALWSATRGG
ncbi:hypothetical protein GRZ55_21030 [Chelativorans sp. ZYF759]|uniref:DUF6455 family protein n=1 Tax=Chelativorans sp. ZYF759 TaxID=2692213 RepID=UPI00145F6B10|nr:DUF6455 family protein [Chelativorans sp. ZYF759]NMG41724.1 hypothetical protein [Chelativorans sp. ZYF759]